MTIPLGLPRVQSARPCQSDPDRWLTGGDDPELRAACRACPRRWTCAKEALDTVGAHGMWAGVYLPKKHGRARVFAMRQIASLAEYGSRITAA